MITPFNDTLSTFKILKTCMKNLNSLKWNIVVVNINHKKLATLYPSTPERPNNFSDVIINHIMKQFLDFEKANFSSSDETISKL